MAKVRADLEGVVYAFRENGETVVLSAGDDIPADIHLGSHLVDTGKSESRPEPKPEPAEAVSDAPKRRGRPVKTSAVSDDASE
ncbi:hypothetical protein [Nocardia cyriacigeorgica]|uniref:hypothetical protein n=1 Tax=Nocardia cyriacigeorgica TaxID=135487 RepID=UPI00245577B8|nr:hypothetical protein [Nocardia cyriacigeorgica]